MSTKVKVTTVVITGGRPFRCGLGRPGRRRSGAARDRRGPRALPAALRRLNGPHAQGTRGVAEDAPGAVPDLTRIEERDGEFDRLHVAVPIEGRRADERTMPCWQVTLENEWPRGRDMAVLKIWKLTRYLDFVQEQPAPALPTPKATAR